MTEFSGEMQNMQNEMHSALLMHANTPHCASH